MLPLWQYLFKKQPADHPYDPYEHTMPIQTQSGLSVQNGYYTKPIAVGKPGESAIIDEHLHEIEVFVDGLSGIPMAQCHLSAREICEMPKTPNKDCAIPHASMWPNMAYLIKHVWSPLRSEMGLPLSVRGYRPPDYNRAVGGAKNSAHTIFAALDIYVEGSYANLQTRTRLCLVAAKLYNQKGDEVKMGLGVYGTKKDPSHIHVDAGIKKRSWGEADYFCKAAKRA